MNAATEAVLAALRSGPKTTLELQALCYTTHAAKPVYDARQLGYVITRRSLPNRVAEYTLVGRLPGAPVEAETIPPVAASSRVPVFGDVQLIRAMRR